MTRIDAQEEQTEESESDQEEFGTDKNGEETWFDDLDDVSYNASTADLSILLESDHYSLGNLNDLPAEFDSELGLFLTNRNRWQSMTANWENLSMKSMKIALVA